MSAAHRFDTDVLIVGAGPTGLALATMLRRQGRDPMIVDRLAEGQGTSRAAVIHAHTLEVLEPLGVVDRLLDEGLRLQHFSLLDRDRRLARLRFDELPTRYACLLMIPQERTEAILRAALAEAGGSVHWNCTVESIREQAGGVQAIMTTPDGPRTIRARYVVGADGMHSVVREAAGIGFAGTSGEESFVLADVGMDWPLGRDEVRLFFSPEGLLVVAPLPGGRFRVVAPVEGAAAKPGVAQVQALLDARGPTLGRAVVHTAHWSSRFRLHHRLADHYRRGCLLLVGDAAHVHSPAGGQGMNTGLVDACVLGRMLAEVLSGRREDAWLDRYEGLRRPAAQEVLALVGRVTSVATLKGAVPRLVRNLAVRLSIGRIRGLQRRLEMRLSGLSRRAAAALPDVESQTPIAARSRSGSYA